MKLTHARPVNEMNLGINHSATLVKDVIYPSGSTAESSH